MDPQLMLNAAPGAWGVCSDSGWMTAELFLGWFKKFIKFCGATVDRPVLLLLDGHRTHTQNIDVIIEARSNGDIILCLPPHTTNKLQVADVAYMRPLSVYYDQQITAWLRSNPGMVVTIRQVAEIFGKAFVQACKMATAVNGFKKCGIWPYGQTVSFDIDFAPSLTTDIPQTEKLPIAEALQALPETTTPATPPPVVDSQIMTQCEIEAEPQPGCSTWMSPVKVYQSPTTPPELVFSVVSPQQVMPDPATRKVIRVTRKRGKTAIITSYPYKNELERS
nr:unnamed protein product [Callosobruchus analis]